MCFGCFINNVGLVKEINIFGLDITLPFQVFILVFDIFEECNVTEELFVALGGHKTTFDRNEI